MIRMLHAADLHLDSPFASLAPEQAARRREEQRELLRRMGAECRRLDCQLLLLAGDLFDSDRVYRETAELLREVLGSVRARVFIAPGNHDPYSPLSPYARLDWPENVHIFTTARPEAVPLPELGVTVWGAGFTEPRCGPLLADFRPPQEEGLQVMVLHGDLEKPGSPYNPITKAEVRASGMDYIALGHVHQGSSLKTGRSTACYPGCPMGRGFDETGPKGVCYVELEPGRCEIYPLDLGARAYLELRVAAGRDPLAAILAALPEEAEGSICRITLTGSCPAPDLQALREALEPRFFRLELEDRTLPPLSLWADLEEDSLKGEFLRQLRPRYEEAGDEQTRLIAAQAVRLGLAIMEGREVPEL